MSTGNTLTAPSGSGLTGHQFCIASCSGLKRHNDSFSEDICPLEKRWYYVLASESEIETEGTESIYSFQEKSTDLAKDTSDTCTKSSWSLSSDDDGRMIEFEVVSLTEEEQYHPLQSKDSSSSPEDIQLWLPEVEKLEREAILADYSGVESDRELKLINMDKSGLPGVFKFCLQCKGTNKYPQFRYCIRCHKLRKNFLPPRPQGGKKKRLPKINLDSKGSVENDICLSSSQSLQDASGEVLRNVNTKLCNICMIRSKDGGFSHGHIVHNYSCYRCSIKVFNQNGLCPVCNIKVKQICRIIR